MTESISEKLKAMIGGDKKVRFAYYRADHLYYVTDTGFEFPVPVADIGNATFLAEDRASLFMRYMRKALETAAKGVTEAEAPADEAPTDPDLKMKVLTPSDIKAR